MKRKITINKSVSGTISGKISIPEKLLKDMGIIENDREVIIKLEFNKLIIEKVENKKVNLAEKISIEITQDERDCLLR